MQRIATEVKIIETLKKQGIDKHDLGREGFLERAWEWKKEYGGRIIEQLKKLGSSCDWDRERFTMDEGCNKAVTGSVLQDCMKRDGFTRAAVLSTGVRYVIPPFPMPR